MGKKEIVRRSFASIAGSYDVLNTLLSFCADKWWRREAIQALGPSDKELLLDACAGTMLLGKGFVRRWADAKAVALDFSLEMLEKGMEKAKNSSVIPVCGDAERMPFRDETFDKVIVGFGIRNLADPQRGIEELFRVLKRGGRVVILEFGRPSLPVFKDLYRWYLSLVVDRLGGIISHQKETYRYFYHSVMAFPEREEVVVMMKIAGFSQIRGREMTLGITDLCIAQKAP
ncbi:MAG: ubiquinone/menaquinone biosynthesis methyltransferase [Deltaproteobacteria bacterium]|nr:MAG: ubiquinone/menaquinone biosynthesis methyltransferase [Deltaproteobacteria bacterium]